MRNSKLNWLAVFRKSQGLSVKDVVDKTENAFTESSYRNWEDSTKNIVPNEKYLEPLAVGLLASKKDREKLETWHQAKVDKANRAVENGSRKKKKKKTRKNPTRKQTQNSPVKASSSSPENLFTLIKSGQITPQGLRFVQGLNPGESSFPTNSLTIELLKSYSKLGKKS